MLVAYQSKNPHHPDPSTNPTKIWNSIPFNNHTWPRYMKIICSIQSNQALTPSAHRRSSQIVQSHSSIKLMMCRPKNWLKNISDDKKYKMWFPFLIIYLLYALVVTIYFTKLIYRELAFTLLDTTNVPTRWLPFVRLDRQNWRMWEIYLGALTIMPIRILLGLVMLSICLTSMVIAGHGMATNDNFRNESHSRVVLI